VHVVASQHNLISVSAGVAIHNWKHNTL